MHCAAQKVVLDSETWKVLPARGQAVLYHKGCIFVVGGKRGKLPSTQMHILSSEKILKGQPALHRSVPMPFEAQQGFSQAIYVIDLDPRSCYAAKRARLRTSPDTRSAKAFVLRSGCALLPHPTSPGHIILHGGRSTADAQPTAATSPQSRERLVLSDWHLLSLSSPSTSSAAIEVHATPLQPTPAVTQARLETCKHCLIAATATPSGGPLPVGVFGGSRGLTTPRPCTVVAVDIDARRVALADSSRIASLQAIRPSPQQAMCCGVADVCGSRGAACLLPGSVAAEMALCAMEVTDHGVAEAWSSSLRLPSQQDASATWTALCVAGETGGRGGMVALAQCVVRDTLVGVFAWFESGPAGSGKAVRDTRAAPVGGGGARKLLLSPVDAAAKVEQARKEAEASGSLQSPAAARGSKRGRDAPERSAAAKRPSVVARATAVADACAAPASKSGRGSGPAAERSLAAPAVAVEDLVHDTPDTLGGDAGRGGFELRGPVLEPGMVQIAAEEEAQLRQAAAQGDTLRLEMRELQQHAAAQVRRGDEQEAAAAGARAALQQSEAAAQELEQRIAAAQTEAQAAGVTAAHAQTRADQLARENEELRKRVREAEIVEAAAHTVEAELQRLRGELQRLEAKYGHEQQQRRALQGDLSAARDAQHALDAERTGLQRSLGDAQARCTALVRERDAEAERLKEAHRELEQLQREVDDVHGRCEAAEAQRDKLKVANGKLETARREVAAELKEIKAAHEAQVGHLQDALQTKGLREQVLEQQHKAAVATLEAQVTSVTERANIYQDVANTASAKKTELEAELTEARQATDAATAQAAELRTELAAVEAARDDATRRSQKLQQKVDSLKQQLQAEVAQRQEAQRNCDAQEAQVEQLQAQVAKAAEEHGELLAFQQATEGLREKYQRMADLAGDLQRVAQETQRGHANAQMRLGMRASSAPSGHNGSGRSPG